MPDPTTAAAETRLEELRAELRAERISWGELAELQELADYIADDDVELLEAGRSEGGRTRKPLTLNRACARSVPVCARARHHLEPFLAGADFRAQGPGRAAI